MKVVKKEQDDNFIKSALKIILRNIQLLENVFVGDNVYYLMIPVYNEKDKLFTLKVHLIFMKLQKIIYYQIMINF